MLKTSLILFTITSIIFSTIYTPQALLPTLKEVFHISIAETNLLLSVMLFVLMVVTPFYAPLAHRFEKKKIMMVSIFFLFLSVLLSAFSTNFYYLLASRVMQGIFIPGITAIMLAYVPEVYPKEYRGLGMGIYMAATGFGAVMGRLLAAWVSYIYSWREAFGVFALLLLLAWVLMAWGLPKSNTAQPQNNLDTQLFWQYLRDKKFLSVLLIPMVVFFTFMAMTTFVTYHLSLAPYSLNESALGSLFLVLLLAVVVSPLAGRLSDSVSRVKLIYMGIFFLILGLFLMLLSPLSMVIVGLGFVVIGMFTVQSVAPIYLVALAPHDKATITVLYQSFFYFGGVMGTLLPSLAWAYGGFDGVVWVCIWLLLLGIGFLGYNTIFIKD